MDLTIRSVVLPIVSAVAAAVGGYWGAYFSAYMKQKGKNLATREDLQEITRATAEIKAQVSNSVWDRQRRWETQRDVMFDVVRALDHSSRLLTVMLATFRATTGDDFSDSQRDTHRAEVRRKWMTADDSLEHAIAVAGLVCGPEIHRSLIGVAQEMKHLALEALKGKDPEPSSPVVLKKVHEIIASVRRELRLGDERAAESGAAFDSK